MNSVITLSRQLGSQGSYVAAAVAKKLNVRYLDREILHRAAEIAGYPDEAMVRQLEQKERVPGFLSRMMEALNTMPMVPTIASATLREGYAYDEQMAMLMVHQQLSREEALDRVMEQELRAEAGEAYSELVRQVIREYAEAGDVLIVGRGGCVVLREHPHVLHVRVQAPAEVRIHNLMQRLGLERQEAERRIHHSDRERAKYMKHFYNVAWNDPDLYHLIVNTGKMTVQDVTELIVSAAQQMRATPEMAQQ